MDNRSLVLVAILAGFLAGCDPAPMVASQQESVEAVKRPTPTPSPEDKTDSILALPAKIDIAPAAHALILEFEGFDARPDWPGEASGVTIGWGYDLGYSDKSVIESDWRRMQDQPRHRLSATSGIHGAQAKKIIPTVRDIGIDRGIGTEVFDEVDMTRWMTSSRRVLPGFDDLRSNAQGALVSLGYNRGWSMIGNSRQEMRDIRDYGVPKQDYSRIANDIRHMKRLWIGTPIERGMSRRRDAEARLVETP